MSIGLQKLKRKNNMHIQFTGRLYLKKKVSPKLVFISVLFHTSTLRSAILFFSILTVHAVDR